MPEIKTSRAPLMIPFTKFDEYKEKYKKLFLLDRTESGVLTAKWHTNGDTAVWDQPIHRAIHQLCTDVGQDGETEVFILGGAGDHYLGHMQASEPETEESQKWMLYEHSFYDGCNIVEGLINDIEIPTIGVINGPGYHTEMAIFCDITLMSEDAEIADPHFFLNGVAGDGIQIALRGAMGIKRANYAMFTCEKFDAQKALDYGLVNEIVPKDKIYDRAMELAEMMAAKPRIVRRLQTQVSRFPWKEMLAKELRMTFGTEMWAFMATGLTHDQSSEANDKLFKK